MTKVAVLVAGVMLGFAGLANAQTFVIDFPGANNATVNDSDGGLYALDYTNALVWTNSNNSDYAPGQGVTQVSWASGASTPWIVTITADPGFEILFNNYNLVRAASSGNTTIDLDSPTNDPADQTTAFSATTHKYSRDFVAAGPQPRGSSITLQWVDGTGNDVAIDSYSFTVQAIPEPTVLAPMALAGMGMFLRRRRA